MCMYVSGHECVCMWICTNNETLPGRCCSKYIPYVSHTERNTASLCTFASSRLLCACVCMFCMCAVCMRYCTYFTHSLFFSMKFDTITAFVMDKMWLGFSNIQSRIHISSVLNTHTDIYTRCSVWFFVLFVYVFLMYFFFVYFLYSYMCNIDETNQETAR